MTQLNLSARAYHRTQSVKLACPIVDVGRSEVSNQFSASGKALRSHSNAGKKQSEFTESKMKLI
jgi:hypothetical protein